MNKKALWITSIAIVVIGTLLWKMPAKAPVAPPTEAPTGEISATFYDQKTGEKVDALFVDRRVTFTNTKLGTMTLDQAISADGARYATTDESIVFWNKGNSVLITQNGKIVFNGTEGAPVVKGKLPAGSAASGDPKQLIGTWMWQKSVMGDGSVVAPKKAGVFALTFNPNGTYNRKTDCNSYGAGEYKLASDGIISLGGTISTQMACQGSQEGQFNAEISAANRYSFDPQGNLVVGIEGGKGTMIFTRK